MVSDGQELTRSGLDCGPIAWGIVVVNGLFDAFKEVCGCRVMREPESVMRSRFCAERISVVFSAGRCCRLGGFGMILALDFDFEFFFIVMSLLGWVMARVFVFDSCVVFILFALLESNLQWVFLCLWFWTIVRGSLSLENSRKYCTSLASCNCSS